MASDLQDLLHARPNGMHTEIRLCPKNIPVRVALIPIGKPRVRLQQLTELFSSEQQRELREAMKKHNPENWRDLVDELVRLKVGAYD